MDTYLHLDSSFKIELRDNPIFSIQVELFSAACSSSTYQKSDGKSYCAFTIKDTLTWYQAEQACRAKGGQLPEIYNEADNSVVARVKVTAKSRKA